MDRKRNWFDAFRFRNRPIQANFKRFSASSSQVLHCVHFLLEHAFSVSYSVLKVLLSWKLNSKQLVGRNWKRCHSPILWNQTKCSDLLYCQRIAAHDRSLLHNQCFAAPKVARIVTELNIYLHRRCAGVCIWKLGLAAKQTSYIFYTQRNWIDVGFAYRVLLPPVLQKVGRQGSE